MSGIKAKKLIKDEFNLLVNARKGKGTAHTWVDIQTSEEISNDLKEQIEKRLVDEGICGSYYTDYGKNDHWSANVSWEKI